MLNRPSGDSSVCTPVARSLKISPAVGAGHLGRTTGPCHAIRRRDRTRRGAARDDIVQIEAAGLQPALEYANQIALHRVVEALRSQNHLERLPQRHVFQLAAKRPEHIRIGHDTEPRVANDHQQKVRDRGWVGERERHRPRAVEIAALLPLVELRDGKRPQRSGLRLRRHLNGSLRSGQQQHRSGAEPALPHHAQFHAPRVGSKGAKPYEM